MRRGSSTKKASGEASGQHGTFVESEAGLQLIDCVPGPYGERLIQRAGCDEVRRSGAKVARHLERLGRVLVSDTHARGIPDVQTVPEQIREQAVVAVPPVLGVHANDEEVPAHKVIEDLARVRCARHVLAQRRRHAIEHGREQQEPDHVLGQAPPAPPR